jgi:unsaturated chondroitin disaccharide hydrolase
MGEGPSALYDMAYSHASKALLNHVRRDGSTFHLVEYDPQTGAVTDRRTKQGKSDDSTWSRGQAWAVNGFTMVFRETGDAKFLDAARATADYFIDQLPKDDLVPQADFQSTYTDLAHKDSSAAAIAASGLFELSTLDTDPERRATYFAAATRILASLTSPTYLSTTPDNAGLLLHGSRLYPGDDKSYIFGDYYLIEAIGRYQTALDQ